MGGSNSRSLSCIDRIGDNNSMNRDDFEEFAYSDWTSEDGKKLLNYHRDHDVQLKTSARVGPWNDDTGIQWGGYSKKNITNKKNKRISKKTKKSKRSSKKKRKNNKTKHKRKNKTKRKNK